MTDDERNRGIFDPFAGALGAFAERHGIELVFDPGHYAWGTPNYQLRWVNPHGQTCVLYLNWLAGDNFLVHVMCWPPEALTGPPEMRWSPLATSGKRAWEVRADDHAVSSFGAILDEARDWANSVTGT